MIDGDRGLSSQPEGWRLCDGGFGINARMAQLTSLVGAVVVEPGVQDVAAPLGDPATAGVAVVAQDLDAAHLQLLDAQPRQRLDGFGHVALAGLAGAQPVADLTSGHGPVEAEGADV